MFFICFCSCVFLLSNTTIDKDKDNHVFCAEELLVDILYISDKHYNFSPHELCWKRIEHVPA